MGQGVYGGMDHSLGSFSARLKSQTLVMKLWCDCGGMGVESSSLGDLQKELAEVLGLEVEISTYMFCDSDKGLEDFRQAKP